MRPTSAIPSMGLRFISAALVIASSIVGCEQSRNQDAEVRKKIVEAINTFEKKMNAAIQASNKGDRAECFHILNDIDPYYPVGVDPELPPAIQQWRQAAIAFHTAWFNHSSDIVKKQLAEEAAENNYKEVKNKLAFKYGIKTEDNGK